MATSVQHTRHLDILMLRFMDTAMHLSLRLRRHKCPQLLEA